MPHQYVAAEPAPRAPRPNCAPAYYLGRPASLWIRLMKPRRERTTAGHHDDTPHESHGT
jgi:hypothetical protein